jgi:hypothetical protein
MRGVDATVSGQTVAAKVGFTKRWLVRSVAAAHVSHTNNVFASVGLATE